MKNRGIKGLLDSSAKYYAQDVRYSSIMKAFGNIDLSVSAT